ncbi:MAG: hypothetical protein IPN18_05020 [Ignavibacteriales bacterium]|nr:hypothetical protein [Ignavibacteriales bacterium]
MVPSELYIPEENKLSGMGLTSFSDFTGGEADAPQSRLTSFTAELQEVL